MKIGDIVEVDTFLFKGKGRIDYISELDMFGVQVELDKPDDHEHSLKRVCKEEIKLINE